MISQTDEKQEPKKKKSKLFILGVVVFIAIVGLTCGYFNVGLKNSLAQMTSQDIKSVTLPSLTVNLIDGGYIKTTITLEYASSKKMENEMEKKLYKVKDSILRVLRNTSANSLRNPRETENLKQELLKEINSALTCGKVTGLYFEEFIVQSGGYL